MFWEWESTKKEFDYYSPSNKKKQKIFTQTVFIPKNSTQAVTGTDDGYIIVWDISLIMEDYSQPNERRQIKVVNLMNQAKKGDQKKSKIGITILTIQDNYLVIGASNGSIRFYDFQYRISAWFEDINIASITSISFSNQSLTEMNEIKKEDGDNDFSFRCPDFIIVDLEAKITALSAS